MKQDLGWLIYANLPDSIIGLTSSCGIVLNQSYKNDRLFTYYVNLLTEGIPAGYDCIMELDGTDTARRFIKRCNNGCKMAVV